MTVAAALAGWPVTVGVVEMGVVSQPAAAAGRYRCACLHCTQGLAGRGDGYQCGLDCGLSSVSNGHAASGIQTYRFNSNSVMKLNDTAENFKTNIIIIR